MIDTLKTRIFQGKQYIGSIEHAPMRSQFRGLPKVDSRLCSGCGSCVSLCPAEAISTKPIMIDIGKCTFCGECSRKCPEKGIEFTNNYKLSSTNRELLIISDDMTPQMYEKLAIKTRKEITSLFSHSLKLRQVSAGGCNGCEMELNACSNVNFDMGRFGIEFVASPRHADGIVITGPISENMAYALENCYNSVPDPKIVILCGACAISGGVFKDSTQIDRSFLDKYKIDLYIPGCPVHPLTFINGVLSFIRKK